MVNGNTETFGMPSQKPIAVKLNKEQIDALDHIVEMGKYNGRSHAIREMSMTYIQAIQKTLETGKTWQGTWEFFKGVMAMNERLDIIQKHATRNRQAKMDLNDLVQEMPEIEVEVQG